MVPTQNLGDCLEVRYGSDVDAHKRQMHTEADLKYCNRKSFAVVVGDGFGFGDKSAAADVPRAHKNYCY
uniref:Uncharacterized protein n=1 Tax=Arion vulgaris TaxID=1028688 RepID=A0A0B6ZAS2_9EUPU